MLKFGNKAKRITLVVYIEHWIKQYWQIIITVVTAQWLLNIRMSPLYATHSTSYTRHAFIRQTLNMTLPAQPIHILYDGVYNSLSLCLQAKDIRCFYCYMRASTINRLRACGCGLRCVSLFTHFCIHFIRFLFCVDLGASVSYIIFVWVYTSIYLYV